MKNHKNFLMVFLVLFSVAVPMGADEIHNACREGDLHKVESLLKKDPKLIHSKGERAAKPLHFLLSSSPAAGREGGTLNRNVGLASCGK